VLQIEIEEEKQLALGDFEAPVEKPDEGKTRRDGAGPATREQPGKKVSEVDGKSKAKAVPAAKAIATKPAAKAKSSRQSIVKASAAAAGKTTRGTKKAAPTQTVVKKTEKTSTGPESASSAVKTPGPEKPARKSSKTTVRPQVPLNDSVKPEKLAKKAVPPSVVKEQPSTGQKAKTPAGEATDSIKSSTGKAPAKKVPPETKKPVKDSTVKKDGVSEKPAPKSRAPKKPPEQNGLF
jgi:hypothetical protein